MDFEEQDIILCLSGGLDSIIAYYYLGKPKTVFFDYGDYTRAELEVIKRLVPGCIVDSSLNLSGESVGKNAYIPYRNMLFALRAASYGKKIVIAGIKDDMVPDKNPSAFASMGSAMSVLDSDIVEVISPFWDMTKTQLVRWFLDNVEDAEQIISTSLSCYTPTIDGKECLTCPSCFRKWNALWENDIQYPFKNPDLMMEYLRKAEQGVYIPERNASIIRSVTEQLAQEDVQGRREDRQVWVIDIDGVLTIETEGHGTEIYAARTPNEENIAAVNFLYDRGDYIKLHTARFEEDREITLGWLHVCGVNYDELILGKPQADHYVDDKMFDFRKLPKMLEVSDEFS